MALQEQRHSTLLEYARQHHLTQPCRISDTDVTDDIFQAFDLQATLESSEAEDAAQFELESYFTSEKLSLDKAGRDLLAAIIRPAHESLDFEDVHSDYRRRAKRLKLALPLLQTDVELDYRSFRRRCQHVHSHDFVLEEAPSLDVRQDDGLSWTSEDFELLVQCEKSCTNEKFQVDRETMVWLQGALNSDLEDEASPPESPNIWKRRISDLNHLTPPLSPLCRLESILESPLTAGVDMFLLSEHTSPTISAMKKFNDSFARQDALDVSCHNGQIDAVDFRTSSNPVGSFININNQSSSSPCQQQARKLKVDEPLTPSSYFQIARSVLRSDDLIQYVATPQPPQDDRVSNSQDEFDAFFNEVIEMEACRITGIVENEQLQEADSTMRVEVPALDFCRPTPPWKTMFSAEEEESEDRQVTLPIALMKLHHLNASKTEKDLKWSPVPKSLEDAVFEERIDQEDFFQHFTSLLDLGPDIDPKTLSWKPRGLRIIDETDDDEELQPEAFESELDLDGLLRKRKKELETVYPNDLQIVSPKQSEAQNHTNNTRSVRDTLLPGPNGKDPRLQPIPLVINASASSDASEPFGNLFSASDEITRFLELQSGHMSKRRKIANLPSTISAATDQDASSRIDDIAIIKARESNVVPKSRIQDPDGSVVSELSSTEEFAVPGAPMSIPGKPRPIIVSSALLSQQRQLIKSLISIQPALQLISREFPPSTHTPGDKHSPSDLSVHSSSDCEADIIISPGTGIILTTLQKIKQRPLPGQGDFSAVQSRILGICSRYERLHVLVCANVVPRLRNALSYAPSALPGRVQPQVHKAQDSLEEAELQHRDIEALASLGTFAATLTTISDVIVSFIPHTTHDPPMLARWIAGLSSVDMFSTDPIRAQNSSYDNLGSLEQGNTNGADNGGSLIQDETTWELLLRKAGMNAFAAQAVLSALRQPFSFLNSNGGDDKITGDSSIDHGVADGRSSSVENGPVTESGYRQRQGEKSIHGLPAFVLMTPSERTSRCKGLMGGSRVLSRVGKIVDSCWRVES